jgi:hypothetical protein
MLVGGVALLRTYRSRRGRRWTTHLVALAGGLGQHEVLILLSAAVLPRRDQAARRRCPRPPLHSPSAPHATAGPQRALMRVSFSAGAGRRPEDLAARLVGSFTANSSNALASMACGRMGLPSASRSVVWCGPPERALPRSPPSSTCMDVVASVHLLNSAAFCPPLVVDAAASHPLPPAVTGRLPTKRMMRRRRKASLSCEFTMSHRPLTTP